MHWRAMHAASGVLPAMHRLAMVSCAFAMQNAVD